MFWIINKDKIVSYLVVVCVIGTLIFLGTNLPKESIQTSANANQTLSGQCSCQKCLCCDNNILR